LGKISKKDKKGMYLVDVITYDLPSDQSKEAETKEKEQATAKGGKYFRGLRQTWIGQVEINKRDIDLFKDKLHKLISSRKSLKSIIDKLHIVEGKVFQKILLAITLGKYKNKDDAPIFMYDPVAIYIKDIFNVDLDSVQPHDQLKSKKRDGSKQSIKYSYISTPLDLSKDTFEEAIKNTHYTKDECWINTLYVFFFFTKISTNKNRNVITREIILNVLNRTEENIKEGYQ